MGGALIFAFNLDAAALEALESICAANAIQLSPVSKAAHAVPLGTLLGMPAARLPGAVDARDFDDPMLVMCGLGEEQFNAFLRALRASGIPRIDLKAVLTPTNISWTAVQLRDELRREHERLRGNPAKG